MIVKSYKIHLTEKIDSTMNTWREAINIAQNVNATRGIMLRIQLKAKNQREDITRINYVKRFCKILNVRKETLMGIYALILLF